MKWTLLIIVTTLILLTAVFGSASAQETNDNLVDIVAKTNSLSTLHTIIVETGQADTLASADNTFTLFAPTNGAFGKLPEGLLDALLADPQGALTELLHYHVVPGQLDITEIIAAGTLTTVSGETLTVEVRKDNIYVNDSRIVTADIPAKNGMIHTMNEVLLPPEIAALPIISEVAAPETAAPPTTPEVAPAEVAASAGTAGADEPSPKQPPPMATLISCSRPPKWPDWATNWQAPATIRSLPPPTPLLRPYRKIF
jgi:uncharacterized surface protein with fasciclin (FAS1) repeats